MEFGQNVQVREISEQQEHPRQLKGSMISKCANLSCSAPFRYLHEGKLFCFAPVPGAVPWTDGIPFRWLCSICSSTMTLDLDRRGEVIVLLAAGEGADPSGDSEVKIGVSA